MKTTSLILLLFVLLAACDKGPQLAGNSSFSLDKFEQNIKNTYGPEVTGYSYAISVADQVLRYGAGGNARLAADGGANYTPETRQELFSVTKFITAIAVCKELAAKGKTLGEPVTPYLPANWKAHGSYNDLTFRQLLSHKSGFSMENRGFDSLKKMMTIPQTANTYNYNNANFALCRILLPYMHHGKQYFANAESQDINETATAWAFRTLIREMVLKPSGLQYYNLADFKDWNHENIDIYPYARYYLWSDPTVPSSGNSDDVLIAGSRGLTLSTYEVAQILTAYEKKVLVNQDWIQEMKSSLCGFDSGINGAHGTYYWKNGGGVTTSGTGGETIIMIFPNGVRVSVNANSNREKDDQFVGNPNNMVKAFDDAW